MITWPWMTDAEARSAEWERWLKPDGVERKPLGLLDFITTNVVEECKPLTREEWERQIACIRDQIRSGRWGR